MAAGYQHVLNSIRKGVADQVGVLLWDANFEASGAVNEPSEESGETAE